MGRFRRVRYILALLNPSSSWLPQVVTTDAGFALCIAGALFMLASLSLLAAVAHGALSLTSRQTLPYFSEFVVAYWSNNSVLMLLAGTIVLAPHFPLLVRSLRHLISQNNRPFPGEANARRGARIATRMLTVSSIVLFALSIPALHLHVPLWVQLISMPFVGVLAVMPMLPVEADNRTGVMRLGKFSFPDGIFCDSASMATTSMEVDSEVSEYYRVKDRSVQTIDEYLDRGSTLAGGYWQGLRPLFDKLALVLGGVELKRITLHENTTEAFWFGFASDITDPPSDVVVFYCDNNYPSINRTITQCFTGSCIPIKISTSVSTCSWAPTHYFELSSDDAIATIVDTITHTMRALPQKRAIVVVTHVSNRSGAVLDIRRLGESLNGIADVHCSLVVDGAQAVGNILVDKEVFDSCAFYVASGHKWLLGRNTLGICVHNPAALKKCGVEENSFLDELERPFQTYDYDINDFTRATISLEPFVALNASLTDILAATVSGIAAHNRALASEFTNLLVGYRHISPVLPSPESGIVVLIVENANSLQKELWVRYGIKSNAIADSLLRLSFHYYMAFSDVHEILRCLEESMSLEK